MVPQLYMVSKQGGKVETYTAQFVVLMYRGLASRVFFRRLGGSYQSSHESMSIFLQISCFR